LRGVATLVLVGDSDPRFPVDLESRAAARKVGFEDLRYLLGVSSTLANEQAVESVLAWVQHATGFRDVPAVGIQETVDAGDLRVDVIVQQGNVQVTGVELHLLEIDDRQDTDFKWAAHLRRPEGVAWRRIDALFAGPEERFAGRWVARFPLDPSRNRAYHVLVRDRTGTLSTAHSVPVRVLWHLGDPAEGPARY
jgi:hypothetical protein